MATIDFRPNKGKKVTNTEKPQKIYLRYRLGRNIDFNASVGATVLIDNWDKDKKRVKNRTAILDRHEINNLIIDLTKYFEDYTSQNIKNAYTPNYSEVKQYFDKFFTVAEPETKQKKYTLFTYIDFLINKPETKRNLKEGSIKNYRLTKTFLERFNAEVYPIDFDSINLEWYNDFIEWCEKQNLSKNYIGKHIKTLKTFLNNAIEDGITDNHQFKSRRFKILKEDADNIYLTVDELYKLWELDLSKEPRKENARDLFLIGAFTGLRVSDYNNIKPENLTQINGVEMITIKTQKTNKEVAIPLHPIVKEILQKNNDNPPPKIPDQKINELIKDISESAGIDDISYTTITRGGKEVTVKKYKFELVKTHTARRSFCTNAYLNDISTLDIMAISGHTSEKTFLNYIKVTPEQHAIRMSKHSFFQGRTHLKAV